MHPICLCLLLPLVLVTSHPTHHYVKTSGGEDLTNEFWSHHFGPDFHHAVHLHLKQTDLINTGNVIEKPESESKEGNKKRSTYIVHKPADHEQENRTVESAMRVHLLQPGEVEALEKEMVTFARGNKMVDAPVVINLPASQGSNAPDSGHAAPVILNVPPVVYHSNPSYVHPRYLGHARRPWAYNRKYPTLQNHGYQSHVKHPSDYGKVSQHGYEKAEPFYEKVQAIHEKMPKSYEQKTQSGYEPELNPVYEDKKQYTYDNSEVQEYENNKAPSHDEDKKVSFEEKMYPAFESNKEVLDSKAVDKKETA